MKLCRLQCAVVLWVYPNLRTSIFRRTSTRTNTLKDSRTAFIHFLKWNKELNTLEQMGGNTKVTRMNSVEEIKEIVSNCLEKKLNNVPDFIRHLYNGRGMYFIPPDNMTIISHMLYCMCICIPLPTVQVTQYWIWNTVSHLLIQVVNRKHISGPRLCPYNLNYNVNKKL